MRSRSLWLPVLLVVLILSGSLSAESVEQPCPSISVIGPDMITQPGERMTFTAIVSGNLVGPTGYEWTVSAGKIVEGQGTSFITIETTKQHAGMNITAKVTIAGVAPNCDATATETNPVDMLVGCGAPGDEYGPVAWVEERARLDNFLLQLTANNTYSGYLRITIGPTENSTTIKRHLAKIVGHFRSRKPDFDLSRLIFAIENDDNSTRVTRIWMVPPKADLPECKDCMIVSGRDVK